MIIVIFFINLFKQIKFLEIMKTNLFLSFLILVFIGCTSENVEPITYESPNLQDQQINIEKYNDPVFIKGKLQSFSNSNKEFVIFSQLNNKKHIFYIKGLSTKALAKLQHQDINSLDYLDHGILLSKNIFFGVKENIDNQLRQDVKKLAVANFANEDVNIIGHIWFSEDFPLYEEITPERIKSFDEVESFLNQERAQFTLCSSGGEGSTGCSITSPHTGCSVSCGSGYYACCNDGLFSGPSCQCLENE